LACKPIYDYRSTFSQQIVFYCVDVRLTNKITIQESNLAKATKREYGYRLGQFYAFTPISSDDELIDYPTD